MSHKSHSHRHQCEDCGTPLSGPYCSKCGQHDVDYNRSFLHIIEDALEGVLHLDGKFFRSARYAVTRPGFLTTEFIAGRRTRYTQPLRFYFFASFLLFAVVFLVGRTHRQAAIPAASQAQSGIHLKVAPLSNDSGVFNNPIQFRSDEKDAAKNEQFATEFTHMLPTAFFVCVPFLGLVLKLAYIRSGRLYLEHLIFALHIQALAFLWFIVIWAGWWLASLAGVGFGNAVGDILLSLLFYTIFRSFRVVYGQSIPQTVLKFLLVGVLYSVIVIYSLVALSTSLSYLVGFSA
jgi:hypothetical protein